MLIGCGIAIASLALAYFIPIPIWNAQFDGIDGYYQSGWCMCVEEIFDEFRDGDWYITSHHGRRLHGTVVADSDHWNVNPVGLDCGNEERTALLYIRKAPERHRWGACEQSLASLAALNLWKGSGAQ